VSEGQPAGQSAVASAWRWLIGPPLRAREVSKERITPVEGLPALSLNALTSVAYGPEAIIVVLAVAGASALHLVLPITITIVLLMAILVFSYRQVIDAYPNGGGAYAVSRANLGHRASLVAAAALVVDYTLTVAVSIAAGVAALTSAFPGLSPDTVVICLVILAVVTVLNLRGLGDAARAFLLPTLVFIVGLLVIIVIGLIHPLALNAPQPGVPLVPRVPLETVSVLLLLKAFSAGRSALTGVEAIANGVPQFKEPRVRRAKRTEMLLGTILGVMLLGLAVLADRWHIGPPSGQTVLSQIMATAVGRNWAYYVTSLTITLVLALAANTSFGGLPVLASLLAKDHYLPHLFSLRDDRQVFAPGIWTLSILSGVLLIAVRGNVLTLIPLFAIGVFTGFTLSQSGLVVHWWRTRPGPRAGAAVGPLESRCAAARAEHRVRVGGGAAGGVHRPALPAARQADRRADPGRPPRPLALRVPAQPLRPGPVRRAARPPQRRLRPGLDSPVAGRRRGPRRLPVTWNAARLGGRLGSAVD
jgi:amino acid transporter